MSGRRQFYIWFEFMSPGTKRGWIYCSNLNRLTTLSACIDRVELVMVCRGT